MGEVALKPCPLCGGKAEYDTEPLPRPDVFAIYCEDCGFGIDHGSSVRADLVTAWNTRAPSPEAEAMAEALEQAGKWFREYEQIHLRKDPADLSKKAMRNSIRAEHCEAALANYRKETG